MTNQADKEKKEKSAEIHKNSFSNEVNSGQMEIFKYRTEWNEKRKKLEGPGQGLYVARKGQGINCQMRRNEAKGKKLENYGKGEAKGTL